MFISCSDDETVKIWGVKEKVKVDLVQQSIANNSKDGVKKIDLNDGQLDKDEADQ